MEETTGPALVAAALVAVGGFATGVARGVADVARVGLVVAVFVGVLVAVAVGGREVAVGVTGVLVGAGVSVGRTVTVRRNVADAVA